MSILSIPDTIRKKTSSRAFSGQTAVSIVLIAVMIILVVYPLASLVYGSINAQTPDRVGMAFSLDNFAKIFGDPQFWLAWRNTIIVSLGSSVIALVCGL